MSEYFKRSMNVNDSSYTSPYPERKNKKTGLKKVLVTLLFLLISVTAGLFVITIVMDFTNANDSYAYEYENVDEYADEDIDIDFKIVNSKRSLADYLIRHLNDGELTMYIKTSGFGENEIDDVTEYATDSYYYDLKDDLWPCIELLKEDNNYYYYSIEYQPNTYYYVKQNILAGQEIPDDHPRAKKLAKKCKYIFKKLNLNSGSQYDKVQKIHNYIIQNTEYRLKKNNPRQYSAEGCLLDGKCVCQGYTYAAKLLCDLAGIPCRTVSNNEHEWNMVKINGRWRHMDVTWDDHDNGTLHYSYFLITDNKIKKDHSWDATYYPKAQ